MKERHLKLIRRFYYNYKKEISQHKKALKKLGTYKEHIEILENIEMVMTSEKITKGGFEAISKAVYTWEEEFNKYKVFLYLSFNYGSIKKNRELIAEMKKMLKELQITYFS